ncbi:MAG: redoxin domain-containing protein [Vicinamibacterales bacterium]
MHVRSPRIGVFSLCLLLLSAVSARAQPPSPVGFVEPPSRELEILPFTDAQIDKLLTTFNEVIAAGVDVSDPATDPELNLWKFLRWLQNGILSPKQQGRVLTELSRASEAHPELADMLEKEARAVRSVTIGKVAPEIEGPDLDGQNFRLSDYRGKVVMLTFTGDWCGICRSEYPYQRLLQELYKDWPFVLLSVNSDTSPEVARKAKTSRGLFYRSWWEKRSDSKASGPIARTYDLYGWPTVYLLDDEGVIRFVDLRQEDLLKAVRQLLTEMDRRSVSLQTGG